MQREPMDVWIANTKDRPTGRRAQIHPILAFLKGDTPQRAIYTSTCGPSGFRFCHGCNCSSVDFHDPGVLTGDRRSLSLMSRVKEAMQGSRKTELAVIRRNSGFTTEIVSVSQQCITVNVTTYFEIRIAFPTCQTLICSSAALLTHHILFGMD
jgi:hypothetical protein